MRKYRKPNMNPETFRATLQILGFKPYGGRSSKLVFATGYGHAVHVLTSSHDVTVMLFKKISTKDDATVVRKYKHDFQQALKALYRVVDAAEGRNQWSRKSS